MKGFTAENEVADIAILRGRQTLRSIKRAGVSLGATPLVGTDQKVFASLMGHHQISIGDDKGEEGPVLVIIRHTPNRFYGALNALHEIREGNPWPMHFCASTQLRKEEEKDDLAVRVSKDIPPIDRSDMLNQGRSGIGKVRDISIVCEHPTAMLEWMRVE